MVQEYCLFLLPMKDSLMNTICSVCAMVGSISSFGFYDPAQWELSICLPWIVQDSRL